MKHLVLGTAGHIDHGKTSFIKALTGIDADRLKEEQERGITIDIGFAHLKSPWGDVISIIDVPGHERFVRNMMAGASGIDFVVLVVAADEGVMPQTREHLVICDLLGIRRGLTVLTKTDKVDEEWLELVREDLADYLAGTFLRGAPIVPVSNETGAGIEEARKAIFDIAAGIEGKPATGRFRMPVDRVFTIKGFGTVVTGTVISGRVGLGDTVELLPLGTIAKIRGLQFHDEVVPAVASGQRAAMNLQGIDKDELERGDYIAAPGALSYRYQLNALYNALEDAPVVKHRMRVRIHLGTREVMGRISRLDGETVEPGETCHVQIRLEQSVAALPGDRFIIRRYSPVTTIGGGVVVETTERKLGRNRPDVIARLQRLVEADPRERLMVLLEERGRHGMTAPELLHQLPSTAPEPVELLAEDVANGTVLRIDQDPPFFIHPRGLSDLRDRLAAIITDYHRRQPLKGGIPREELRSTLDPDLDHRVFSTVLQVLQSRDDLRIDGARVALPDFEVKLTTAQTELRRELLAAYSNGGFSPPGTTQLLNDAFAGRADAARMIDLLVEDGSLVKIKEGMLMEKDHHQRLLATVTDFLAKNERMSVSDFKDLTGASRKIAVPLLEYLDAQGLTRRSGDDRILKQKTRQ
ncbi:selenocysteine-specific translation elongation factor [bacterium]|nr:selenocysteine-specific translation elongation factor [candidate division CSSED10-310 bacterium]